MVSSRALCVAIAIVLVGTVIFPPEVMAGGLKYKKLFAAYMVAKALKPRFVPIPLPLPFPIKLGKDSHVKYPVHSHSHSAHAQFVDHGFGGHGGGFGGHGGGFEGHW